MGHRPSLEEGVRGGCVRHDDGGDVHGDDGEEQHLQDLRPRVQVYHWRGQENDDAQGGDGCASYAGEVRQTRKMLQMLGRRVGDRQTRAVHILVRVRVLALAPAPALVLVPVLCLSRVPFLALAYPPEGSSPSRA
jgi:hypothetical protein